MAVVLKLWLKTKLKYLVYIILILFTFQVNAQEFADKEFYLIDSLVLEELPEGDKNLLHAALENYHNAKSDTSKIYALHTICENMMHMDWIKYQYFQYDFVEEALQRDLDEDSRSKILVAKANCVNNIGVYWGNLGQIVKAREYYMKGLKIRKLLDYQFGIAESLNNIGSGYESQGDIQTALIYFHESLQLRHKIGDQLGMAISLGHIGKIYANQIDYDMALKYIRRSLKIFIDIGNKEGMSNCYQDFGTINLELGDTIKAISNYKKALKLSEEVGYYQGVGSALNGLGFLYMERGSYVEATTYFQRALEHNYNSRNERGLYQTYQQLGDLEIEKGNLKLAENYSKQSLNYALAKGFPRSIELSSYTLSHIYELQGKGMKALEMYKLSVQMKDSMNNEATQKATIRQQTQYEFEKAQIVKENEAKEQARLEAEATGRRNNLQYSLIFLGILVLFVGILFLGFIKVSPTIAEGIIFFAFLILFEFVLVFTEPYLENYTQGQPMYNLLANSLLALLIFPVHAILENLLKKRIVK